MKRSMKGSMRLAACLGAAVIAMGSAAALPAATVEVQAAASSPAYTTQWTTQYPFLTLLKSSLGKTQTDASGIYEQIMMGIKYQTISEADILQLVAEGYSVPAAALQQLYTEGWISGYLYKSLTGQGFTADDFQDVFDANYYVNANPAIAAAVQSGALAADKETLFQNYLVCGIPAGLSGNETFRFAAFEEQYPEVVTALGGDRMAEVTYYILHKDSIRIK